MSKERHCNLTGDVRQSPTVLWFHILKISGIIHRIHLFLHILHLWCELVYCLVIFSHLLHRLYLLDVLALSEFLHFVHISDVSISEHFLSQTTHHVVELDLVLIQQIRNVRPLYLCSAHQCYSVCRCTSPMHLLRASTWSVLASPSLILPWLSKWSLLPSRRHALKFDGLALLNTRLLVRFPCSDEVTPKRSDLQMNETSTFPSIGLSVLCTFLSRARPLHRVSPTLLEHTVAKSESFVTLHQKIHCFTRSRRNESATGSGTSLILEIR